MMVLILPQSYKERRAKAIHAQKTKHNKRGMKITIILGIGTLFKEESWLNNHHSVRIAI